MGRAIIITTMGAILALGVMQIGMNNTRRAISEGSARYANEIQIRNTAFTASQIAMERINETGGDWHPQEGSPWEEDIEGYNISLYYDLYPSAGGSSLDSDTVRIYTTATFQDGISGETKTIDLINTYTKSSMHFVPEFRSALSFATDNFNFSAGGSSQIIGNEATGSCADRPAIAVQDLSSYNEILTGDPGGSHLYSDSTDVAIDPDLSYEPVDELVARLAELDDVTHISGNYKGDFGTADNPGIFFVEDYAKLTGGVPTGYGIMVVRSGGELEYEGELSVAGNFEFNGLVIFENAFDFTGRGTPNINGSVLVGTPDSENNLDVDLSGNITLQYDCTAETYAQLASANALGQNRYKRLSTYE